MKEWLYLKQDHPQASAIAAKYDIPLFLANIMINRGLDDINASAFLNPSPDSLCDPYLMQDMDLAVARIEKAISEHEIITIYGDYDVDGITSVSLLYQYLTSLGATVYYYIPDRISEGYGINTRAIDKISQNGTTLIISVDTGIGAVEEVEYAKALNIDFIITDHHECPEVLPAAVAVCNPKRSTCAYPFKKLAGVGVVFKLICALALPVTADEILDQYADLVALGTVSDVMPLVEENRYIVKKGLNIISFNRKGLHELIKQAGVKNHSNVSVFDIGFLIAPRINAAGRIGDTRKAVELLISDDPEKWEEISAYLCETNNERQRIEGVIFEQADAIIQSKRLYEDQSALVLWHGDWHHGVIGIVASRIKEKYGLPTILFSVSDTMAKGSARSVEPLNLYEALNAVAEDGMQFGGHAMAAGITLPLEALPEFSRNFRRYAKEKCQSEPYTNMLVIDACLQAKDFTLESFKSISLLEPFGTCNEVPLLSVKSGAIRNITPIGNRKHLKLTVQIGSKYISAVYFGVSVDRFGYSVGDYVDLVFQPSINDFRGKSEIQMIIKSIRPYHNKFKALFQDYKKVLTLQVDPEYSPDRNMIASIYRFCRNCIKSHNTLFDIITLPSCIHQNGFGTIHMQSIILSLMVLKEIGVLNYSIVNDELLLISINDSKKVSLETSKIFQQMNKK